MITLKLLKGQASAQIYAISKLSSGSSLAHLVERRLDAFKGQYFIGVPDATAVDKVNFGAGGMCSSLDSTILMATEATFLPDALGSTFGLASANNGPIATNYTYQPFGATTVGGSANGNSYEFTGRENDGTGLYCYRARYYSPTFQRFIAQDPIGFRGGDRNLYAYVRNNPISSVDPAG